MLRYMISIDVIQQLLIISNVKNAQNYYIKMEQRHIELYNIDATRNRSDNDDVENTKPHHGRKLSRFGSLTSMCTAYCEHVLT